MGCFRAGLVGLGSLSCLLSGASFWVLHNIGWRSDGPGALCPMIVLAGSGFVAVMCWKEVFFGGPPGGHEGPPFP